LPSATASPVLTSLAYSWAAVFAHNEGANMAAEDLAVRGLALAERTDDNLAVVMAMNPFAQAAFGQGNMALAAERAAAGLKLADRGGPAAATIAFWFSITMLELGNPDRAEQLLAEAPGNTIQTSATCWTHWCWSFCCGSQPVRPLPRRTGLRSCAGRASRRRSPAQARLG
jgi:hypothetical protein